MQWQIDAPTNSLKDPKVGPRMKQRKKNRVGACSITCSTLGVGGCVGVFGMGLRQTHKRKFKMMSTYTTKKKKQLVEIRWKWCDWFSKDNLKHKFHTTPNHSPPYAILCAFLWGLHPNVTFPRDSQVGVPKLGILLSQNVGCSYLFQIKFVLRMSRQYLLALENIFPMVYNMFPLDLICLLFSMGLWVQWVPPFHNSCKSGLNE
jgi:hypothetical protein